ncbi:MAG: cobalamin B12-binding domain-containing protein [Bradymonadales bacterium]|nr:MAG: cobalamin B12-binding domain-containing protein [Bradymonadales bacterium]
MAKLGLDGHDRGAKVVMAALRDAGMEVIYSGLHQTPAAVARAAVEEDVDVIGLSILSGAHKDLVPRLVQELAQLEADSIPIALGGIIPDSDRNLLKKMGVRAVFSPGTRLDEIVDSIRSLREKKSAKSGLKKSGSKTGKKPLKSLKAKKKSPPKNSRTLKKGKPK